MVSYSCFPATQDQVFISLRHVYMVISEIVTFFIYGLSLVFLPEYFGK